MMVVRLILRTSIIIIVWRHTHLTVFMQQARESVKHPPLSLGEEWPFQLDSKRLEKYFHTLRPGVQNMSQTTSSVGSSKILRLFGVNLECQQQADHESEPSTPDGSSSLSMSSSQGPTPHHHLYPRAAYDYAADQRDFSFSRDGNPMRNRRG
ncbi:B3 domain-containing protein [Prunus yedoensis var. nudiflora]|uniref:B3 domain-containing protein n=1 Tax=Prunus yedoensis var. nudiflora TaxID=2094558 RepID=A0A314ZNA5_PRUYE|nr:B3 domain-containing protein [Prunus yedoensis var. nudiflora]